MERSERKPGAESGQGSAGRDGTSLGNTTLRAAEGERAGHRPLDIGVVSVQSLVVYGRVGNNVAWPVLHAAGLTSAIVPTVMFSNTPHYPSMHGGAMPPDWFAGYLDDLLAREALGSLRAVLVGYMGDPEQLEILSRWLGKVRAMHPQLLVVVDPVIGDDDCGVYVKPGILERYRHELLPLATGLTPNGFELASLTGLDVGSTASCVGAARSLLGGETQWVVVTSAAPAEWPAGSMQLVVVTKDDAQVLTHPRIDSTSRGTGDLFSASLLVRLLAGDSLTEGARHASEQVGAALQRTRDAGSAELILP